VPNRECNLTKRVRTPQGLRFCPVVLSVNGRVKPDWVLVNGKEERHPEGAYYIEWREGSKRMRASVGKDAADANARRLRNEAELNAVNNGVAVAEEMRTGKRRFVTAAVAEYLDEIKISRSAATHSAYELALRNFTESCPKTYLEDINRSDLLHYIKHPRSRTLRSNLP
jgi:integrase/recombinase XerD